MGKLTEQEKTELIQDLCYHLDWDVYLPTKNELEKYHVQYSLGFRKEEFKKYIEQRIKEMK